jgi:aminoglycoside phosphotransferase (APT) family kinase protein
VADRILPGWDAFDRRAPFEIGQLIHSLGEDPSPLVAALATMPSTLIHGDLKLANVGIASNGTIDLVDWQMVTVAPVAVELGWFLVSNVASLPFPPDDVLTRYHTATVNQGLAGEQTVAGWRAQTDAAILVGLLLRGWRKGADADAGLTLASGVTAADDLAWWWEQAIDAAGRLL